MRPSWHIIVSLISLTIYITVTKTPPSILWLLVGTLFGVLIDVDHLLHAVVFQRELTLRYLKHHDLVGFYKEFRNEGIFDNLWFNKILWKNILYYLLFHGTFILFIFWLSPYAFGSLDTPIRVAIVVHYFSDIVFHTYRHVTR